MTSQITFYLSQIIGSRIYDLNGNNLGKVIDIIVDTNQQSTKNKKSFRPIIVGIKTKINGKISYLDFGSIKIESKLRSFSFICDKLDFLSNSVINNCLPLAKNILDRQIVDINGKKLVRVNDIRMVSIPSGTFAIAVDIGMEGLFRRLGADDWVNNILRVFKLSLPTRYILWNDVEAFDSSNYNIKLSDSTNKLQHLHPSDLADIIEDMSVKSRTKVFESLDEEKAADVLEEMEPYAQAQLIESLSIGKAADVLEKMPADEVADLFDGLEKETVELLLNEMEKESSQEVRELLGYEDKEVGSFMTTDYLSFRKDMTIEDTLNKLRLLKPEADRIYSLFITDMEEKLIATVSLRDIVVSQPNMMLSDIMNTNFISVKDDDKIDILGSIISKYDLLAIPVTDESKALIGMVVIDDIVEDLMSKGKTKRGGKVWH